MTSQTIVCCFLLLLCWCAPSFGKQWSQLAPGIEYRDLGNSLLTPWSHVHVFRVDLKHNQLDLLLAKKLSQPHASIEEFAQFSNALITLNGGFFDESHQPLGLRISHQQQLNPLKPISWWAVFYIKGNRPYLSSLRHYKKASHPDFALQSGPRLLIDGIIPSLKPGLAERSALGITRDNRIIILVTEHTLMSTTMLAELLRAPPLNCEEAINLDGGSSSQLKASIGSFQINTCGLAHVSDAIIIQPRTD